MQVVGGGISVLANGANGGVSMAGGNVSQNWISVAGDSNRGMVSGKRERDERKGKRDDEGMSEEGRERRI